MTIKYFIFFSSIILNKIIATTCGVCHVYKTFLFQFQLGIAAYDFTLIATYKNIFIYARIFLTI